MRKLLEVTLTESCLNKANDGELLFVLMGRDIVAPTVIRFWCEQRIKHGKNNPGDPQIVDAMELAADMAREREEITKNKG